MGLKILHSADWHLDSPFAGFPDRQKEFLRAEQRRIPGMVTELAKKENCDLILLSGDIFDGKATPETLEETKRALGACGIRTLIAPGNHDYYGADSVWASESWPDNVYIFKKGIKSIPLPDLECRVYGAAFQSMDCASLLEGFRAEGGETYQVAVLHGDPTQKNSPYNPITVGQVRSSGLSYLALGHVHTAGAFRAGRTICAWPGCPMGRGWDETGDKGVCIVTLTEQPDIQAVSLDTLRFHKMAVDVSSGALPALEAALPGAGSNDFFRVDLTGCGKVDLQELRRSLESYPNLELRDRTEAPIDVWAEAGEDTLEGVYFHMLRKRMEERPEEEAHIQQAAEISRRLLLGREVTL